MKKKTASMMITTAAAVLMTMHAAAAYTPGTYDAAQGGIGGDITLHVTFSEEEITDITADHNETVGIGADAIEVLIDKTLEEQAVPADTISGATVSSTAYINALKDVIEQAAIILPYPNRHFLCFSQCIKEAFLVNHTPHDNPKE